MLTCRPSRKQHSITIHHSLATPISRCGEQVWQGACLLGDWVLANRQQLQGQVVIELGAGVGLVSILAGMFAATVFLTDADVGALQLAQRNAADTPSLPPSAASADGQGAQASRAVDIRVRLLDWLQLFDAQLQQLPQDAVLELLNHSTADSPGQDSTQPNHAQHQHQQQQQQQVEGDYLHQEQQQVPAAALKWCASDLQLLSQAIWLAADVVYDQTLTDTFMNTAATLMRWQQEQQQQQQQTSKHARHQHQQHSDPAPPPAAAAATAAAVQPRLMVALEKRYNFTLRDMDAVAPAFDHFMSYLQPTEASLAAMTQREQQRLRQQQQQQQAQGRCLFRGKRLDVDGVPQVRLLHFALMAAECKCKLLAAAGLLGLPRSTPLKGRSSRGRHIWHCQVADRPNGTPQKLTGAQAVTNR
jgi:hypothetical protein